MTDKEMLASVAHGGHVSQKALSRLQRLGWIVCDNITTLDSDDAKVLAFISLTETGENVLKS
jgi:hypothetical protein